MDLETLPFKATRYPGVWIHFFQSDPVTRHAAVMIKMEPGCSYPRHRHLGPEELLILQGGFRDAAGTYRALSYARFEAGTSHHPVALEDGPACIFFAIAAEGIDLFEDTVDP